jgi:hypothetical protein
MDHGRKLRPAGFDEVAGQKCHTAAQSPLGCIEGESTGRIEERPFQAARTCAGQRHAAAGSTASSAALSVYWRDDRLLPCSECGHQQALCQEAANAVEPPWSDQDRRRDHLTLWSAAEQGSCGLGFLSVSRATQGCWPGQPPPLSRFATPRLCADTGMEGCRSQHDLRPKPAPLGQSLDNRQS